MRQTLHQAIDVIFDALDFAGHIQRARADLLRDLARMVAPYIDPIVVIPPPIRTKPAGCKPPIRNRWRTKTVSCDDTMVLAEIVPQTVQTRPQPKAPERQKPTPKPDNRPHADILDGNTSDLTGLLKGLGVRVRKNATREELQQQVMNTLFGRV